MKVTYFFDKCILCLKNPADSWEHIIPKCIGGKLLSKTLCKSCNNFLGTELISQIPEDPSIKLAIDNLKNQIPNILDLLERHLVYFDRDKDGNLIKLKREGSGFKVLEKKLIDGSLILDTKKAQKHILNMLQKNGLTQEEINNRIESLKTAENGQTISLSNEIKAVKRSGKTVSLSLQGSKFDNRIIALIAYEYLSLLIGELIYNSKLDFIRKFIIENITSPSIDIEKLRGNKYEPYHFIFPEYLENEVVIQVSLFGFLVYRLHLNIRGFKDFKYDFFYLEDLVNKRPIFAQTVEEAKQNKYYLFQSKVNS